MKASRLAIVALLSSAAAFGAAASEADFYNVPFTSTLTRAQVQAELAAGRGAADTYAVSYNPLNTFRSERTRAEVRAEFLANRDQAAALTGEDSGSAYLAAHKPLDAGSTQLAGTPVRAQ